MAPEGGQWVEDDGVEDDEDESLNVVSKEE